MCVPSGDQVQEWPVDHPDPRSNAGKWKVLWVRRWSYALLRSRIGVRYAIVACAPSTWRIATAPSGARSSMVRGVGLLSTAREAPFQVRSVPSYSVNDDGSPAPLVPEAGARALAAPLGITRTIRSPVQVRTSGLVEGRSESYSGASGMTAPARAKTGGPGASSGAGTVTSCPP